MARWQHQQRAAPVLGAPNSVAPAIQMDWWQNANTPVQHYIVKPRLAGGLFAPPDSSPQSPPSAALDWFQPASEPIQHRIPKPRLEGWIAQSTLVESLVTNPPELSWFQPASTPVYPPKPRQQGLWTGVLEPTLFTEPNPALTWLPKADPLPIRVSPRPHGGMFSPPLPYVPPPNFWTPKEAERHFPARPRMEGYWTGVLEDFVTTPAPPVGFICQPQMPPLRPQQRPMGGTTEPLGAIPVPTGWWQPASVPVLPPKPRQQGYWCGQLELNVIGPDVPYPTQDNPPRAYPRRMEGGTVAPMLPSEVATELDWLPVAEGSRKNPGRIPESSLVSPLLPSEVAADLDWWPIAGEPLRVVPRPHGGESAPVFTPLPVVPLTQDAAPLPPPVCAHRYATVSVGPLEPTLTVAPIPLSWQPSCAMPPRGVSLRPTGGMVLPLLTTVADAIDRPIAWRIPARPHTWKLPERKKRWLLGRREKTWKANIMPVLQTFEIYVGEVRQYGIDFADMPEIADDGQTLSSLSSLALADGSGVTLASTGLSGTKAVVTVTGVSAGVNTLKATVVTSAGRTLIGEGVLKVVS